MGSALTIIPIQAVIHAHGYQAAFLYFGIGYAVIVLLAASGQPRRARGPYRSPRNVAQDPPPADWKEMVVSPCSG